MKKITAIFLSVLMLIFVAVPVMATGTQQSATASNSVGKTVTMDGVMGTDEGWGTTPVTYLDRTFGVSGEAENAEHGEIYLSVDQSYIYYFIRIYEEYNTVISDSSYQTFIKAYFGEYGEEEIGFWGTAEGSFRKNPSVKTDHWTTGEAQEAVGYASNDNSDGSYTIECKLPLPSRIRNTLLEESVEIKIGVVQCLGEGKGVYLIDSETVKSYTKGSEVRSDEECSALVTLPYIDPTTVPAPTEIPTVVNVAGKTVNVDGAMSDGEGWADTPYMLLDKTKGSVANTKPSKLYLSTDGEYLYGFFQSEKENWDTTKNNCQLYFYINFSDQNIIDFRFQFDGKYDQKPRIYKYVSDESEPLLKTGISIVRETDVAKLEFKLELPDRDKELLKQGTSAIKIGVFEKENADNGNKGKVPSEGFPSFSSNVEVTLPMVAAIPVFTDVYGKNITVDGTMGSAEGWAKLPYMVLSATTDDGETANGTAISDLSGVRYAADAKNIYVFFETANMTAERLYLQFAFDGKTAGAEGKGYFLTAELDITPTAEESIVSLTYGDALSYAEGDVMYDGVSAAVRQTSDRNCVELCIPIPKSVADKRLEGTVTVKVGAYEKLSATSEGGYIPESGYNATAPDVDLVLAKDDASVLDELKKWLEQSKTVANYADLTGLSVNVFGDSYFTGGELDSTYTWAALLATKYGWTFSNNGSDGNMVSDYGNIDPLPMVKRYRQLPNNSPDLIIVTGGYYDWQNNVPLGDSGSRDTETYIGALNALIDGLKSKYKDSAILFVTPWNYTGTNALSLTYRDYAEAMVETCEAKGVYCYKAYDSTVSGVDMQNAEFRADYAVSADDSYHLNLEGMKLAMPKVEAFLNESVAHWFENYEDEGDDTEDGTSAEDTDATVDETQAEEAEEEKKGCGSSVNLSVLALLACTAFVAVLPLKKREE